jgi:hypothetical protein
METLQNIGAEGVDTVGLLLTNTGRCVFRLMLASHLDEGLKIEIAWSDATGAKWSTGLVWELHSW